MEKEKDYIFVYGLFRDHSRKLLGDTTHLGKSSISGRLYKVNELYPGFVECKNNYEVWGDIFQIENSVLPSLDEYEGEEYIRRRIKTTSGLECWVYEYKYDTKKFDEIKTGDWYLR